MKKVTTSGKDINDALMKQAGFKRHPNMDDPSFNSCGRITYWTNDNGLNLITNKDEKITLERLIQMVTNQAAYWTRRKFKDKVLSIDFGQDGFVR